MILSIIIPVYNGAATIGRCLDSIYSQGMVETDFEVICVDDCSPDPSSVAAIENYKFQGVHPSNLILIKHETNKRQGGARNTGVRVAKGEWIEFVDCDDYLMSDTLKKVLLAAQSNQGLEMIFFDFIKGTDNHIIDKDFMKANRSQVMTGADFFISQISPTGPTVSLFKRKCFYSDNLWFVENHFFEDGDFVLKYLLYAKKVLYVPIDMYFYVRHIGQTTDIGNNIKKITDLFLLYHRIAKIGIEFKDNNKRITNHLLGTANAARIVYMKKYMWKIPFRERLSLLRELSIPYKQANLFKDFTINHPLVTCISLSFLNQPILDALVKIKKIVKVSTFS